MSRSYRDYMIMTPRDLLTAIRGFYHAIESQYRSAWERTRWLGYVGLLPYQKKGQRLTPKSILLFPWEVSEVKKRTQDDIKAMLKRIAKRDKKQLSITLDDGTHLSST